MSDNPIGPAFFITAPDIGNTPSQGQHTFASNTSNHPTRDSHESYISVTFTTVGNSLKSPNSKFHSGGGQLYSPVNNHLGTGKQLEKETLSPIASIKQAILPHPLRPDQTLSTSPRPSYIYTYLPEKVSLRTSSRIITRDGKTVSMEKQKRHDELIHTGFNSSTREPYRSLGEPILNLEDLVATTLGMTIRHNTNTSMTIGENASSNKVYLPEGTRSSHLTASRAELVPIQDFNNKLSVSSLASHPIKGAQNDSSILPNQTDSHLDGIPKAIGTHRSKLKQRLDMSHAFLQSVKYGVPFSQTFKDRSQQVIEGKTKVLHNTTPSGLESIDREKMQFYLYILENAKLEHPSNEFHHKSEETGDKNRIHSNTTSKFDQIGNSQSEKTSLVNSKLVHNKKRESNVNRSDVMNYHIKSGNMDMRSLEQALGLNKRTPINAPELLTSIRQAFRKCRIHIDQELEERMEHYECQRKAIIVEKYRAFNPGVNGIASSDLEKMRRKAALHRRDQQNQRFINHPWYSDLLKIIQGNTPSTAIVQTGQGSISVNNNNLFHPTMKKQLSEEEKLLLHRIRRLIGDGIEISNNEFIKLLQVIPSGSITNDTVQRILKFLQIRIGMTELEYLHALETSGKMRSGSDTNATN